MIRYIAFLRAINVGGHNVKMTQLIKLFESMSFTSVETFIASGNVIFNSKRESDSTIARKIESTLHNALGYEVATFIRSDAEVAAMSEVALFTPAERAAAHSLSVGMLGDEISAHALEALAPFNTAHESLRAQGREIHLLAHVSTAQSKFSNTKFERALGVPVTFRNVNTLVRLTKKYPAVR